MIRLYNENVCVYTQYNSNLYRYKNSLYIIENEEDTYYRDIKGIRMYNACSVYLTLTRFISNDEYIVSRFTKDQVDRMVLI